jgi:hypothetical protein
MRSRLTAVKAVTNLKVVVIVGRGLGLFGGRNCRRISGAALATLVRLSGAWSNLASILLALLDLVGALTLPRGSELVVRRIIASVPV